jgi:hypothetical protein
MCAQSAARKKEKPFIPEGLLLFSDNIITKGNIFGANTKAGWAAPAQLFVGLDEKRT